MNKNLIPFASAALIKLCHEIDQNYQLQLGGAEMVLLELLALSMMQADPAAAGQYLATLAVQMPKGDDFDEEVTSLARNRLLEAIAEAA